MKNRLSIRNERSSPGPSLEEFENLDVDPAVFDHEAHLFVAWTYLQQYDLPTAINRYRKTLRRLTDKLGVPDKYHETMTWFYLIVIAERIAATDGENWQEFCRNNQDLFERNPGLVRRFYSDEQLQSDRARKNFILPMIDLLRQPEPS